MIAAPRVLADVGRIGGMVQLTGYPFDSGIGRYREIFT